MEIPELKIKVYEIKNSLDRLTAEQRRLKSVSTHKNDKQKLPNPKNRGGKWILKMNKVSEVCEKKFKR